MPSLIPFRRGSLCPPELKAIYSPGFLDNRKNDCMEKITDIRKLEREGLRRKLFDQDIILFRTSAGAQANIPQRIVYHSPDGFEWGYMGSGPAELALNILYCFLDGRRALTLHQLFKERFLAAMHHEGGTIKAAEIRSWICRQIDPPPGV
ncbi:hypothetical protein ES707_18574 [subsurface metagenome]